MKKKRMFACLLLVLIIGCAACSSAEQSKQAKNNGQEEETVTITVSAAASLQDALGEIKKSFEKKYSNVDVTYNFGSSGTLAQQISQGAPVDLFFSAAEDKFDALVKDGSIKQENSADLVGNDLVLIVPKEGDAAVQSFEELPAAQKVAIGTPESVPAGQYAKETLQHLYIWDKVSEKLIYAKDVRQVLTYVETGNVDAGLVYKTDALISSKIKIAAAAEEKSHAPIIYPAGIIESSKQKKEAALFYQYLQSEEAMNIFEKYGFKGLR
ncbi:molybdate ABC transporter substrate-binding protein [Domibacillus indicus]|uniref:molybdate ABC transporter substrate-binding protein n=1 Tax=Domibacillus indicus TaxID=1437523 RepID=UPI0020423E2C|nr:molybdate ABC transporter substrate-binding protein [Domibacillus indicus]MCM3790757.1 molybdate ABC transporter substrate-binding protein [Domibacillus indicus]